MPSSEKTSFAKTQQMSRDHKKSFMDLRKQFRKNEMVSNPQWTRNSILDTAGAQKLNITYRRLLLRTRKKYVSPSSETSSNIIQDDIVGNLESKIDICTDNFTDTVELR